MAVDFSDFELDRNKEEEGVWEPLGGDARILVASASIGNKKWIAAIRSIPTHQARQLQRGTIQEEAGRELWSGIFAKAILLGWENMTDHGKPVKYSEAAAKAQLLTKAPFFDLVFELAMDRTRYRPSDVEEDAKNS